MISFNIFPSIIAMVFAINIFLDSNFVNAVLGVFTHFKFNKYSFRNYANGFLRPISGTATLL